MNIKEAIIIVINNGYSVQKKTSGIYIIDMCTNKTEEQVIDFAEELAKAKKDQVEADLFMETVTMAVGFKLGLGCASPGWYAKSIVRVDQAVDRITLKLESIVQEALKAEREVYLKDTASRRNSSFLRKLYSKS